MHQPSTTAWLVATILTASSIFAGEGEASSKFKTTTKRDTDRVEVKVEKETTVVSIHSPFGISQAVIERTEATWPAAVVLRLHLKGLESFRASNGTVTLDAAISSAAETPAVRLWLDGKEHAPLESSSRFWMKVRLIAADGKPAKKIPLSDGYIELPLPAAFFEKNPKSVTLSWIDFYRN
jgi:hypothetical protein